MVDTEQLRWSGGPGEVAAASAADLRPLYRVAIFGLTQKFQRVMEIVLRHARHNQYRYVLADSRGPGQYDIALVDMTVKGGPEVASTLRRLPGARPVVRVGRRHDAARGADDLLQSNFTLHLLKALNRVVDEALQGRRPGAARAATAAAPGAGPLGAASPGPAGATGETPVALIVDDSPTVRRQLSAALQQMGVASEGVDCGREALRRLTSRRYDLVFVDVVMPDLDGYRLTREIKRDPALRTTPVIILTSRSSPLDLARGALAGSDSYLVKPVSLQTLRTTVARRLRRATSPQPSWLRLA